MKKITEQKYILVTGGELMNKGAQAMSFIVVDQMAKRYPEHKVILFSSADAKRDQNEKNNYKFEIIPFPNLGETFSLCTGLLKRRYLKRPNGKFFAQYRNIFRNAEALLDISGYALGSKWGEHIIDAYLRRLYLAKHYNIPVYLMPQSFGPFDFKGKKASKFHARLRRLLPSARVIMARENEGLKLLTEMYNLKNVIKTPDMVLQNKGIVLQNVYNVVPDVEKIDIKSDSVAIIPNSKNNKFGSEDAIIDLYKNIINLLLSKGKNIYFIYHAIEDLKICETIKSKYFENEEKVYLIKQELSCVDFDGIVGKFDFIIGSRFHSIVHAYRRGVPAIILGWATKYRELAEQFDQVRNCFDSSLIPSCAEGCLQKVEKMCDDFNQEFKKISNTIRKIQEGNVFDLVKVKDKN